MLLQSKNLNLYLSNGEVENFTDKWDSSVMTPLGLELMRVGVVVEGNDTGIGVYLINGASGWMYKSKYLQYRKGFCS